MYMVCFNTFPGFVVIPVYANNDKPEEGAAETALERAEHDQGTAATLEV